MPIYIDDKELEDKLSAIGKNQDVPSSKRALASAILRDAVHAVEASGDDRAWVSAHREPQEQPT